MPIHPSSAARRLVLLSTVLRLTTGLLSTTAFTPEHQPFGPDGYNQLAWIRAQLAPLAPHDRLIRELIRVLDPERPPPRWSSPRAARRELLRLSARLLALRPVKPKRRRRGNRTVLPGHRSLASQ